MKNTFWTLIENDYYRVHERVLKHAPYNMETNSVELNEQSVVEVISSDRLELINFVLGSHFDIDDF